MPTCDVEDERPAAGLADGAGDGVGRSPQQVLEGPADREHGGVLDRHAPVPGEHRGRRQNGRLRPLEVRNRAVNVRPELLRLISYILRAIFSLFLKEQSCV